MAKAVRIKEGYKVSFEAKQQNLGGFTVTFFLNPNAGVVTVNGVSYVDQGQGVFAPGSYTYEASSAGYFTKTGTFYVDASDMQVNIVLSIDAANAGFFNLNVDSVPSGADFYLGGIFRGITPLSLESLRAGTYSYAFAKTGYATLQGTNAFTQGIQNFVKTLPGTSQPAGTYLGEYCVGTSRYKRYADGSGGEYSVLVEQNSTACGYVPSGTSTVTVTADYPSAYVNIVDQSGAVVAGGITPYTKTLPSGSYTFLAANNTDFRLSVNSLLRQYNQYYFDFVAGNSYTFNLVVARKTLSNTTYQLEANTQGIARLKVKAYISEGSLVLEANGSLDPNATNTGDASWVLKDRDGNIYNYNNSGTTRLGSGYTKIVSVNHTRAIKSNNNCFLAYTFDGSYFISSLESHTFFFYPTLVLLDSDIVVASERWSDE